MRTNEVPYCNTSASVRRAEEVVAELITESRSSFRCPCIDPCTKVIVDVADQCDSLSTSLSFLHKHELLMTSSMQIVYKYQSESLTVNMDYGRLKVCSDYNSVCVLRNTSLIARVLKHVGPCRSFMTRRCGAPSERCLSIHGSNCCATLGTSSVSSSVLHSSVFSMLPKPEFSSSLPGSGRNPTILINTSFVTKYLLLVSQSLHNRARHS